MSALRPIDILFDQADLRCVVCNTPRRDGCGCHTKCRCGWTYRKGETCRNPLHAREEETLSRVAEFATPGPAPRPREAACEAAEMVLAILDTKPEPEGEARS